MTKFTPHLKKEMKELTRESLESEREIGAPICKTEEGLEIGRESKGGGWEAGKIESCRTGEKVGTFHTHPPTTMTGKVGLSSNDVEKFVDEKENWACVGGRDVLLNIRREKKTNDVVRCFQAGEKELKKSKKEIDNLWRKRGEGEMSLSEVRRKAKDLSPYQKYFKIEL